MDNYDYQVVVIGSGPGGYAAALRAAQLGLKVACVDEHESLGGVCVNVGCIPSKALLQATEYYEWIARASQPFGIQVSGFSMDFPFLMQRKQQVVQGIVQSIVQQFKQHGVSAIQGRAEFIAPHQISVQGKTISSAQFIIASGSEPISLPFLPFDEQQVVSSTGALSFERVPKRLLVIGGGAIGLELASVYQRLGSQVVVIEMMPTILPTMDREVCRAFLHILKKQGIQFHLPAKVSAAEIGREQIKLTVAQEGSSFPVEGERVLVAIGRRAATAGWGLEKIGVRTLKNGLIEIDGSFRTSLPHIYAIGDAVEGPMLAHKATHEGTVVAELIAGQPVAGINYAAIPNVVYTYPEVAAVGLTESEALEAGIKPTVGRSYFRGNARARCAGTEEGFVKVVADSKSQRLIGMHILAAHASEMIAEGLVAINQKATVKQLADAPHPHPTLSESIMEACAQASEMIP